MMRSLTYANAIYTSADARAEAVVWGWISASGRMTPDEIIRDFQDDDATIAGECRDDGWLGNAGLSFPDAIAAVARLRARTLPPAQAASGLARLLSRDLPTVAEVRDGSSTIRELDRRLAHAKQDAAYKTAGSIYEAVVWGMISDDCKHAPAPSVPAADGADMMP